MDIQSGILYQQNQLPIFQNLMYDSHLEAKNCPRGDVRLIEDPTTGLIYNAAFQPELMTYDGHYQNEQGISPLFRRHLEFVSRIIERSIGKVGLVEVGCGKGYFLELLLSRGFDILGFDPTYEGNSQRVHRKNFEPGVNIQAHGLVLRHVLEHVKNPFNFLQQLKFANGGCGKIYIEVPCFDWICRHRAWFDIFYEHVNYFRISDFQRMFGKIVECGKLFGDQYLYVVADLTSLRLPQIDSQDRVRFPEQIVHSLTEGSLSRSNQLVIWGGASKGVIFALMRERAGWPVDLVIDINPAKQGKYLPATGLLVQAPDSVLPSLKKGSTIYVMNSNYLDEIKTMSHNKFNYIGCDHA